MRRAPGEEGRRWLEQAKIDLDWTRHLLEQGAYYLVCFLSQQVAEKALKACLYAQGEEIVTGHSVDGLLERLVRYDAGVKEKRAAWACLDGYYIPTRYPNGLPDSIPARVYNEKLARDAASIAEEVVAFAERWLAAGELPQGKAGDGLERAAKQSTKRTTKQRKK